MAFRGPLAGRRPAVRAAPTTQSDPSFASVVLLAINESGADGSTTFVDQSSSAQTLTAAGGYAWSTAQAQTATTSSGLGDGSGDWIVVANNANLVPGLNVDATYEFFIYGASLPPGNNTAIGYRKRNSATGYGDMFLNMSTAGVITLFMTSAAGSWNIANAVNIGTYTAGTWAHVAVNRTGTAIRGYLNGTGVAAATSGAALYTHSDDATIAGSTVGAIWAGWTESVRLTIGVGRYPGDFTAPSLPFPSS